MRCALFAFLLLLALTAAGHADDRLLQLDNGAAETYEKLATDSHYIQLSAPTGWKQTFAQSLSFYGYRYGDVGQQRGTVVIWSLKPNPDAKKPVKPGQKAPPANTAVIHASRQFALSEVPAQPGWFSIELDPVELPRTFGVSLFTGSSEAAGVWVGLTAENKQRSSSAAGFPATMAAAKSLPFRRDGRNWLLRLSVRETIAPDTSLTSVELSGAGFGGHDDGGAEGFGTVQRGGPMVRFTSNGKQKLSRVYVHAKLEGDWLGTERVAGVWILDEDFGILYRASLPYARFTNVASWGYVDIPEFALGKTFYVLVEPVSRPQVQMLIGYDTSSANKASMFGDAGAVQPWGVDAPEERTNWMIRVQYK